MNYRLLGAYACLLINVYGLNVKKVEEPFWLGMMLEPFRYYDGMRFELELDARMAA